MILALALLAAGAADRGAAGEAAAPALGAAARPALAEGDERGGPAPVPRSSIAGAADESSANATSERAARRAFEAGIAHLARLQSKTLDGSLSTADAHENPAPVGVTALGALAFLAGGNVPGRGPYGAEVARAIDYLLSKADLSPTSDRHGYVSAQGDTVSRMHGHGFATLALAEAYGMTPPGDSGRNQRLRRALAAAVRRIEAAQAPEGGWSYEPRPSGHEGSITICLVQALRAARNAGIAVDAGVIRRAEDYVLALRNDEGMYRYQLGRGDATIALTAAAVATLEMAGRYDDAVIQSGVDAIWRGLALRAETREVPAFPLYERLYVAQALWQLSDPKPFETWFAEERERIVGEQRADGSWSSPRFGSAYATAVNCLVLALPEGLLPIFQR